MLIYRRYVAIGDSSTEGLDDPDGSGGYRGWADRLAAHVAAAQKEPLLYANLGIRGRRSRRIRQEQLEPALAMRPDLATIFAGTNDLFTRHFDADVVAREIETIQRALIESGATVLTFTMPDLTPVMPVARLIAGRLHALNDGLRDVAASTGAILVDFAHEPLTSDRRYWSADRLHANSAGHASMAAALAQALGIDVANGDWGHGREPAPPRAPGLRLAEELKWGGVHLLPWILRHMRGRSSGDAITAKRPRLAPVSAAGGLSSPEAEARSAQGSAC
jgi:lysophospholipase L1-like esterase